MLIFSQGGFGNLLTLLSIPYVRVKYGTEFSLLQLNSVVLILHLSFTDLLYCLLGFPHFIQVWMVSRLQLLRIICLQIYFTRIGPISEDLCFALGMLRKLGEFSFSWLSIVVTIFLLLVAYVDFNTIAMISCCVARQNMCRLVFKISNYIF